MLALRNPTIGNQIAASALHDVCPIGADSIPPHGIALVYRQAKHVRQRAISVTRLHLATVACQQVHQSLSNLSRIGKVGSLRPWPLSWSLFAHLRALPTARLSPHTMPMLAAPTDDELLLLENPREVNSNRLRIGIMKTLFRAPGKLTEDGFCENGEAIILEQPDGDRFGPIRLTYTT